MQVAWKFKLCPTRKQDEMLSQWQHRVGSFYNFCLGDRKSTYEQTKNCGTYCDLKTAAEITPLTCSVNKSVSVGYPWKSNNPSKRRTKNKSKPFNPRRTAYEMQSSLITQWRKIKPWYKEVCADVLQQSLRHLDRAFQNFFARLNNGFPRFKRHIDMGLEFKPGTVKIKGNRITFPRLGEMKFFGSRPITSNWLVRTVTIRREANGWYVSLLLRDNKIPDYYVKKTEELNTVIGVDVGVTKVVSLSDGTTIVNPNFLKKHQRRLKIRQRRLRRKKKGSKRRAKAGKIVAKLHQNIRFKREDFQWKLAKKLAKAADVIAWEDLNIKGMRSRCKPKLNEEKTRFIPNGQKAKSQLNKAISDASWYNLKLKTIHQAKKKSWATGL